MTKRMQSTIRLLHTLRLCTLFCYSYVRPCTTTSQVEANKYLRVARRHACTILKYDGGTEPQTVDDVTAATSQGIGRKHDV